MNNFIKIYLCFVIATTLHTFIYPSSERPQRPAYICKNTFEHICNRIHPQLNEQEQERFKNELISYLKLLHASAEPEEEQQQLKRTRLSYQNWPTTSEILTYYQFTTYITGLQRNKKTSYKKFCEHVADFTNTQHGHTLLEQALVENNSEVIINLTRYGANLNKSVLKCRSLLEYAQQTNKHALTKFLRDRALHLIPAEPNPPAYNPDYQEDKA